MSPLSRGQAIVELALTAVLILVGVLIAVASLGSRY